MRGVTRVTAARDWLAATSSDSVKGAVGWHGKKGGRKNRKGEEKEGWKRHIEEGTSERL
jgi:hypothetical protein